MKLGVNVDHVATLRQARRADSPDPVWAAEICERAGCDSIVCHLREDRRHINDNDLKKLRKIVKTKLNLEMSCVQDIVNIALEVVPDQATLVPERREEVTTEGGLDVVANYKTISDVVRQLDSKGIAVSLFIDPQRPQIETAKKTGAKSVELHTGRYANAPSAQDAKLELESLVRGTEFARSLKLQVFAGHGLDYENAKRVAQIKEVEELNIGHAIISHAVVVGLESAVRQMLSLLGR